LAAVAANAAGGEFFKYRCVEHHTQAEVFQRAQEYLANKGTEFELIDEKSLRILPLKSDSLLNTLSEQIWSKFRADLIYSTDTKCSMGGQARTSDLLKLEIIIGPLEMDNPEVSTILHESIHLEHTCPKTNEGLDSLYFGYVSDSRKNSFYAGSFDISEIIAYATEFQLEISTEKLTDLSIQESWKAIVELSGRAHEVTTVLSIFMNSFSYSKSWVSKIGNKIYFGNISDEKDGPQPVLMAEVISWKNCGEVLFMSLSNNNRQAYASLGIPLFFYPIASFNKIASGIPGSLKILSKTDLEEWKLIAFIKERLNRLSGRTLQIEREVGSLAKNYPVSGYPVFVFQPDAKEKYSEIWPIIQKASKINPN
jgi:hypothetical protein